MIDDHDQPIAVNIPLDEADWYAWEIPSHENVTFISDGMSWYIVEE